MESNSGIDMSDDVVKFCVSWTTITVTKHAVHNFVKAWNAYRIPGVRGGIPNGLARRTQTAQLPASAVPITADIIDILRRQGGSLSQEGYYGRDPLHCYPELQCLRERYSSMERVFQSVLDSDGRVFKAAIHHFIHLTLSFSDMVQV